MTRNARSLLVCLTITTIAHTAPVMAQTPCGAVGSGPLTVPPTLFLPVELGDGAAFENGKPQIFQAALRAHPSLGIGSSRALRLGPTAAVVYFSPEIEPMGGARASYRVLRLISHGGTEAGVHLAGEALWGTRARRTVSGALAADAFGLAQINLRVGREIRDQRWFFELSWGVDIAVWARGPVKRPTTGSSDPFPGLTEFFRMVAVQMGIQSSWVCQGPSLETVRGLLDEASGRVDESSLKELFRERGLSRLAATVDSTIQSARFRAQREGTSIPDFEDSGNRKALVQALVRGLRKAVQP